MTGARPARRKRVRVDPQRPVVQDALDVLAFLGDRRLDLVEGRYALATAYLMVCGSVEHAQRLLAVVEQVHAERGVDLHAAVRPRTA
jgi:hypothetical protein